LDITDRGVKYEIDCSNIHFDIPFILSLVKGNNGTPKLLPPAPKTSNNKILKLKGANSGWMKIESYHSI
jgi:hypothetical protein